MAGQGYTPSLGNGAAVLPSPTTFTSYSLAAGSTTQLQWPVDNFPANSNVVAELMAIIPLGAGAVMQMPSAINTSLGEKGLFFNGGSIPFVVADSTGATIISIPSGAAYYLALVNNLTGAGLWLTFQFGAGTSQANAAALAGAGLTANGIFLQQVMQVTALNVNYSVAAADRDILFNWTGGAGTITLPVAASVGNNFYIQVRNSGSGSLAINASGSDLINAAATITFNVADSAFLVTDGTNWFTIGLGTVNTNIFNFQIASLAAQTGTYVLPPNLQGKVAYRFTGALAGNTIIQVPATIQQYWVDNQTTGGFSLSIATAAQIAGGTPFVLINGARFILYCDTNNVLNADTAGISVPLGISQGGTGATTAGAALTSLGGTSVGVSIFTAANAAAVQLALQVKSRSDTDIWALIF